MTALLMLTRRTTFILIFVAVLTLLGSTLSRVEDSAMEKAELTARDFVARHSRLTPRDPKLIFLAIDSDSTSLNAEADLKELFGLEDAQTPEARALALMSQHWPWPRSVHALILDRLMAAGARVVAFDLIFPAPSDDDDVLRAALDRYPDRVVVGSNFTAAAGASKQGRISGSLTLPAASLIPPTALPDPRVGFVNFWPDPDGVIRQARFQGSLAELAGGEEGATEANYFSLAARAARGPARPAGLHPFRFTGAPQEGFAPRSIFEIFVPEYWKRNFQSGTVFQDAIVVIGAYGNWQHDEHPTPFGVMAGPEIQLNVVNALLHGEFLKPISAPAWFAVWGLAGVAAVGGAAFRTRPAVYVPVLCLGAAAWLMAQIPLTDHWGLLVPTAGPILLLGLTGLFTLVYDLVAALAEQLRLQMALFERKRAQERLKATNEELERRVAERTAELTEANSELTAHVHEKDVLLKEIHHRVKNNLQVISSLLNLQSGSIADPAMRELFKESRNRVRSMALIHEKLYQSHDLARIDFQDYLKSLTSSLASSFGGRSGTTRIRLDVESIALGVDAAVPCGLIVNELVTNCYKHAFQGRERGEITVALKRVSGEQYQLSVSDDGVGLPHDLDFQNTESLGMQIVTTLSEQLNGTVAVRNGCGSTFEISFTEPGIKPS